MIIRSFVADSVATALKEVRSEMGGNAVVLKTRQVNGQDGGGRYEVTACLDNPTAEQAGRALSDRKATVAAAVTAERTPVVRTDAADAVQVRKIEERLNSLEEKLDRLLQIERLAGSGLESELNMLERTRDALLRADVPFQQIMQLLTGLKDRPSNEKLSESLIDTRVRKLVEKTIDADLKFKAGDRVLFVGPAGAGKTSAVGKLAAQLVTKQKLAVKLVSLDNSNVGAYDEIASYAELLGVEVTNPTFSSDDTKVGDDSGDAKKVVLIDTGSLPTNADGLGTLTTQINKLRPTHRLAVFSALMRSSDVTAFGLALKPLEPSHLVFTMTDLTDCRGGVLAAAEATGLKIALTANAPSGIGALEKPKASSIASALLGREVKDE